MKYAEQKKFCICIEVNQLYEGDDYKEIYKVLSTLKNKKLKLNIILIEKPKDMLENPDFEQKYYFKTSQDIYKIGYHSITLIKGLAYFGRSHYEKTNFYDLMASFLIFLRNDI